MSIQEELNCWEIINPEHLSDGAYVGQTAEGIALFTSNGISITRPVFLDSSARRALAAYQERLNAQIKEQTSGGD